MPGAATEEVDRFIVGNAEEPGLRLGNPSLAGERLNRFGQRILQDVLAVDNRTGYAGAVAMQLRPQLADQPLERRSVGR